MKLSPKFMPHSVTVTPLTGRSSTGNVWGTPFPLRCMAQGARRLVRDGDGAEKLSTLTLIAETGQASLVPPGSQVEWRDDTTTVLSTIEHDDGGMGTPQHTEVVCE